MLHALLNYRWKVCSPPLCCDEKVVKLAKLYMKLAFLTMKVPSLSISISSASLTENGSIHFQDGSPEALYMGHSRHQSQSFWKRHGWKEAKTSSICMNPLNIPSYSIIFHMSAVCFQNLTSVSDVFPVSIRITDEFNVRWVFALFKMLKIRSCRFV